jgi:hypothetical protein
MSRTKLPDKLVINGVTYIAEGAVMETVDDWRIMGVPKETVMQLVRDYRKAQKTGEKP